MRGSRMPYWGHTVSIIREYPHLHKRLVTPLEPQITRGKLGETYLVYNIKTGGYEEGAEVMPSQHNGSSPVEKCVIHDLPPRDQWKYNAVDCAIKDMFKRYPSDADDRMLVIDLVHWKRTHTLQGAAMNVPCASITAGRWQAEFIKMVARNLKFI